MRRFLPKLFVLVLLPSLCSAKVLGAGIVVETTVKRVFEDGSFETLEFPTENQAGLEESASDSVQVEGESVLNFQTTSEMTFNVLGTLPEQNSVAKALDGNALAAMRERANVPAFLPDSDEVVPGDVLRYELRAHNANAFAVPAYALELIEHLPPGVTFLGLSAGQTDWALQAPPPEQPFDAGVLNAIQSPLRLYNTQILAAGAYSSFSYDVVVQGPSEAELLDEVIQLNSEGVPGLDDFRPQLQVQD